MFNQYSIYSTLGKEQVLFQEENSFIIELNKITNCEELKNFISCYCKDKTFKKEFSKPNNISLIIEKELENFEDNEFVNVHISAKQFNKEIYNSYWSYTENC